MQKGFLTLSEHSESKGFAPILILIGILVIIAVAGGAFYLGRQTTPKPSPVPVVASQTPQPTFVPSVIPTDETANWKTYTNTKYGYTMKYPNSWYASKITTGNIETVDLIYFYSKPIYNGEGGGIRIVVGQENSQKLTAKELKSKQILALDPSIRAGIRITELKLNSVDAVQIMGEPDPGNGVIDTFLVKDVRDYSILLALPAIAKDKTVYNQILSTFKFTQ